MRRRGCKYALIFSQSAEYDESLTNPSLGRSVTTRTPFFRISPPPALSKLPRPAEAQQKNRPSWWLGLIQSSGHLEKDKSSIGGQDANPTASVHLFGYISPTFNQLALFPKSLVVGCSQFKRSHHIELLPDHTPPKLLQHRPPTSTNNTNDSAYSVGTSPLQHPVAHPLARPLKLPRVFQL